MPQEVSGALDATDRAFAIVVARFNEFYTRKLMEGAVDALLRHGADEDDLAIVWVPGAFELPLAVRRLAETGRFDAVIGLGLVLKGDTAHHEVVTSEAVHGIAAAALATGVPCPLGIVNAETTEQAIERCGSKQGNRGWDAAMAALEMVNVVGWIKSLESRVSDPPVTTVDAAPVARAGAAGKGAPRRRVRKRSR